eukprot:jgi/Botrbrau1/1804/Bobra.146_1s0003.1
MQSAKPTIELKQHLADKASSGIDAVLKLSAALAKESASHAVVEISKRFVGQESALLRTEKAVAGVPELLAGVDASCSVILHHMDHLSGTLQGNDENPRVSSPQLPLSTRAMGPSSSS